VAIDWVESHPDPACDLVIGKLVEWYAAPPWNAVAVPRPLHDVTATGYPYDRMAILNTKDYNALTIAIDNPRYLKGYVSRALSVRYDDLLSPYTFEVSFALTEGMSGCPLWYDRPDKLRNLYGIASGALNSARIIERGTRVEEDGTQVATEKMRIEDFGGGCPN
jgi:hypothetical protein